jgi:hypothetical protein
MCEMANGSGSGGSHYYYCVPVMAVINLQPMA